MTAQLPALTSELRLDCVSLLLLFTDLWEGGYTRLAEKSASGARFLTARNGVAEPLSAQRAQMWHTHRTRARAHRAVRTDGAQSNNVYVTVETR